MIARRGGKAYSAFVDFKAAFDTEERNLMMKKLYRIGIRGRMLKMIKTIYANTTARVRAEGGLAEEFQTNVGVRQGCALSAILF